VVLVLAAAAVDGWWGKAASVIKFLIFYFYLFCFSKSR